jgi:hypothetical protein
LVLRVFLLGLNDGLMSMAPLPRHRRRHHGHRRVRVRLLHVIAVMIDAELNIGIPDQYLTAKINWGL